MYMLSSSTLVMYSSQCTFPNIITFESHSSPGKKVWLDLITLSIIQVKQLRLWKFKWHVQVHANNITELKWEPSSETNTSINTKNLIIFMSWNMRRNFTKRLSFWAFPTKVESKLIKNWKWIAKMNGAITIECNHINWINLEQKPT